MPTSGGEPGTVRWKGQAIRRKRKREGRENEKEKEKVWYGILEYSSGSTVASIGYKRTSNVHIPTSITGFRPYASDMNPIVPVTMMPGSELTNCTFQIGDSVNWERYQKKELRSK